MENATPPLSRFLPRRKALHTVLPICWLALSSVVHSETLQNWYHDPFIQVRNAVADCPLPLGPFSTEAEAKKESHSRVERGNSCWLAGKCSKPNSYLYDAAIAQSVQAHFARDPAFARSSLWLTFQRRFVWVEGCSADPAIDAAALEAFVRAEPDIERVIVNLRPVGSRQVPYPVAPQR
ncbi:BON domain-containing protein [Paraherbaspirillum soli]|uniref:BON domain-containing protein n=1 Tax=Paraherbaspirillum soli TaxID=631222 RepID=A0ABW0M6B5_9BURK